MKNRSENNVSISRCTAMLLPRLEALQSLDGSATKNGLDQDGLCQLLKEYGLGVVTTERIVQDVAVDLSYFDPI